MDASLLLADPLSENMAVFCSEDGGSNCTNPMALPFTRSGVSQLRRRRLAAVAPQLASL